MLLLYVGALSMADRYGYGMNVTFREMFVIIFVVHGALKSYSEFINEKSNM